MTRAQIIATLAEYGAQQAEKNSSTDHPEDLANTMSFAIECAGGVLETLSKKGYLK